MPDDAHRLWGAKAESDWSAVEILLTSNRCPTDAVCFHCQQYVEKHPKALLTKHAVEAPRTHDLRRLIQLAEPLAPQLSPFADRADELTIHGVQSRYPDDWVEITASEMQEMVALSRELGGIINASLEK